jgi:integrase
MARSKLKADRVPGLFVRTMETGSRSYLVIVRDRNGKQVWQTIGSTELFSRDEARDLARDIVKAIKAGKDRSGPKSFDTVAQDFMVHHVQHNKLRSEKEIQRKLDKIILPEFTGREFTSINRGDVSKLLDKIVERSGPVAADATLSVITKMTRWYATRHSDYTSPIVPGMRRSNPKERQGKRILNDQELGLVWKAAEANGMFGAFIRLALLTGQRREKIATMKWEHIDGDVWTIPAAPREKGNAGELVLPKEAVAILAEIPRFANSPYVFTSRRASFGAFSAAKREFDAKVPIPAWKIHDLRRTARSLMAAAGVEPHIAELVLGHVQKGIVSVYDLHPYRGEKADALLRLQHKIAEIVSPPPENVLALKASLANKLGKLRQTNL